MHKVWPKVGSRNQQMFIAKGHIRGFAVQVVSITMALFCGSSVESAMEKTSDIDIKEYAWLCSHKTLFKIKKPNKQWWAGSGCSLSTPELRPHCKECLNPTQEKAGWVLCKMKASLPGVFWWIWRQTFMLRQNVKRPEVSCWRSNSWVLVLSFFFSSSEPMFLSCWWLCSLPALSWSFLLTVFYAPVNFRVHSYRIPWNHRSSWQVS